MGLARVLRALVKLRSAFCTIRDSYPASPVDNRMKHDRLKVWSSLVWSGLARLPGTSKGRVLISLLTDHRRGVTSLSLIGKLGYCQQVAALGDLDFETADPAAVRLKLGADPRHFCRVTNGGAC